MMVDYAPPLKDLALDKKYDLQWVYPDLQMVMPFSDGKYLALYKDPEKTYESIKKFSIRDANSFRDFARWSQVATDLFLAPATYVNAQPPLEQAAKLEANELLRRLSEYTELTPKQIVDNLFENDRVRALFLYLATMWGLDYDLEGLGYLVPLYLNRGWHFRLCRLGSHNVAHLLGKFISESGGRIMTGQMIKRIIVEDGEANGVEFDDGRIIKASKFVCSSLNPHQTFFDLVGKENLASDLVDRLNDWRYSDCSFFTLHMALFEAPRFKVAESDPDLNKALVYLVGYEAEDDLVKHFKAAKSGELVDGGFNCCFPSVHDPGRVSRRPGSEVKHVGLISMEYAPYDLKDGGPERWYRIRREYAERCKATLQKYTLNMTNDNIAWDFIGTPLDIENKFPDMVHGCFKQGAYLPLQMGYFRPNEYLCQHTTPIKKLYICGASTHSGGMITYGPGYCATQQIAEDLGIKKWWPEEEHVKAAREAGLF